MHGWQISLTAASTPRCEDRSMMALPWLGTNNMFSLLDPLCSLGCGNKSMHTLTDIMLMSMDMILFMSLLISIPWPAYVECQAASEPLRNSRMSMHSVHSLSTSLARGGFQWSSTLKAKSEKCWWLYPKITVITGNMVLNNTLLDKPPAAYLDLE